MIKKLIILALIASLLALSSCGNSKHKCEAYGSIKVIEKSEKA